MTTTPNTPMPAERLEEIRRELEAATPGPWACDGITAPDVYAVNGGCGNTSGHLLTMDDYYPNQQPDAQFIADAPTAIAELLGEVKRLKNEASELKAKHERNIEFAVGELARLTDGNEMVSNHIKADTILVDLINDDRISKAFEEVDKWYS